jgi:beta-lactamase regulating signal transducer with metallopeptidase domain
MNALYWLWHGMIVHLWQTTLILGVLVVIGRALRSAPARVSHTLWSIGLAKLFLPLSVFGGLAGLLGRAVGHPVAHGIGGMPVLEPVLAVLYPFGGSRAPAAGSAGAYALVAATSCWAALSLLFVSRLAVDLVRARRHGGRPVGALDPATAERLGRVLDAARMPRDAVLVSPEGRMPAACGIFRTRIVIPEYLVSSLSDDELRAILLHEDEHRRRRDPLRGALHRLTTALFFPYPPLYLVLRRLRATAEFACDERVVYGGVSAPSYARALARTLELGLASPAFASAAAVAGSSLLTRRLRRLSTLDPRRYAMRLRYRVPITLAALVVAAATLYPPPMRAGTAGTQDPATAIPQKADADKTSVFDVPPSVLTYALPTYPEDARRLGAEAMVIVSLVVGVDGKATKVKVLEVKDFALGESKTAGEAELKGIQAELEKSALAAAEEWLFKPASLEGKPVPAEVAIPISFKLH